MRKLALPFFVLVILAAPGCTVNPAQQGINLVHAGQHQEAYFVFRRCANAGNPNCINNIGVMYEHGMMQGGADKEEAIEYYSLAARMGAHIAQQNLRRLGAPVPPADLAREYTAPSYYDQQAAANLGKALGCLLAGGGCYDTPTSDSPSVGSSNPYNSYHSQGQPASSWQTQPQKVAPAECGSDVDCGIGQRCVKPSGTYGRGQCVQEVDQYGTPIIDVSAPSVGPREVPSCVYSVDCPVGFSCQRAAGQMRGLCVK